ncbi:MAG: glycoside hydrolase family 127 protein [Prevotella sp.]|nr:glycoside hydrolase family 127 protein [Prevotella sp.]
MRHKTLLSLVALASVVTAASAQTELYPRHFSLDEVTLLDGPMKTAMYKNIETLLQYDTDRLLTPYVRQAGLAATTDSSSPYYQWLQRHPNFSNWGDASFDLSGHVGGHYLSALALAYAACHDAAKKAQLKERMDYMVAVMADCQAQYDQDTDGLYGFIGGQPVNADWKALYQGNIAPYRSHGGWVPFYCQHKILAGLRDAYIYGDSETARQVFRKLADWSVNVVARVSDADMETLLNIEHGGMNESMLDAYQLFGEQKYLTAAMKYTHKTMLNGMQTLNKTFLDGKHANTQVPKYIGMERIGEQAPSATSYTRAADNFWQDVAQNRTTCIGGNSVSEHFLAAAYSNRYIDQLDGPESCNTNNMLKLSEMMSDRCIATDPMAAARYADFYEQAVWNHILSTQDPETGGYVYFTTLRPQGYRIYSQVNQAMWCCVGTGMENHSKYGHFIYTHDGSETLYVNLFTPSRLESDDFVITQQTLFPNIDPTASALPTPTTAVTTLTVGKAGTYTIALRHPAWAGAGYQVRVNGSPVDADVAQGTASYLPVSRTWQQGDRITVVLPMELRYEVCPNYTDYIAFKLGPILLAAQTTAATDEEATLTGLEHESLQNEYAGAGRMDHAPGSMASMKSLTSAPMLLGSRADVLTRISQLPGEQLRFSIDVARPGVSTYKWQTLCLKPFYQIHHARYMCYWYQQTEENYANSDMARTEAANEALAGRTLDFVAPGEQQSEAGHEYNYSADSGSGNYNGESYRDARAGGYVQYTLYNAGGVADSLAIMCRFTTADNGRKATLYVDGVKIADVAVTSSAKGAEANGFYNVEFPIPASVVRDAQGAVKTQFVVRLAADKGTMNPGLYYLRLMRGYNPTANAYRFQAADWTTGDPWRLPADNISYDTQHNIIKARQTGSNNIALMLRYQEHDYDIDRSQTFLVVRGNGLATGDTDSYLWWLNGSNHGTQVAPAVRKAISVDGTEQTLIAWNMATSGLYENFTGQRPSVCLGQTIFGLTASTTDGSCEIHDINFAESVAAYENAVTGIGAVRTATPAAAPTYNLKGMAVAAPAKGIYIRNGRELLINRERR